MDSSFHRMRDLFRQLGLPDEPSAVERFVTVHLSLIHISEPTRPY